MKKWGMSVLGRNDLGDQIQELMKAGESLASMFRRSVPTRFLSPENGSSGSSAGIESIWWQLTQPSLAKRVRPSCRVGAAAAISVMFVWHRAQLASTYCRGRMGNSQNSATR